MMMVSLEDHSVESTWLITLVDESAKWAIPFYKPKKTPTATLHNFGFLLLQQLIVIDVPVTRQLGGRIFALLVLPSF